MIFYMLQSKKFYFMFSLSGNELKGDKIRCERNKTL